MKKNYVIFSLFFLLVSSCVFSQTQLDSLLSIVSSGVADTTKVNALLEVAELSNDESPQKANEYLNQAYILAKKSGNNLSIAKVTNQLGTNYFYIGDYEKALRNFLESLNANELLKNSKGVASCFNNIGSLYVEQGNYKNALEYHFKALKIREENEANGTGDKNAVAMSYGNIGQAYYYLNDYTKAMDYYNRSLRISESSGNKKRIALMLNNIGSIYAEQKFYDNALVYYTKSLGIQRQLDNKQNVAMSLNNIAEIFLMKKEYDKSIDYYNQGLVASKTIGDLDDIKTSYEGLHNCYLAEKNFEMAHNNLLLFYTIKDSIYNSANSSQINEMLTKFDTNKKEQEIQLLQKDQEMHKFLRNSLIIGCVLILIVALLLFNRNKVKQKANVLLSQQKEEIEHKNNELGFKNKEITDSIKYAKHLQLAILPPDSQVKKLLPDSFVLYKPKDIVSGDFYWIEEWGNNVLVAAADCTGHGVPGAFMSIVGNNLLQQAVFNYGLSKPFLILNNVNKNISRMLHQSEETATVKDGMDIALISIDRSKKCIEFAGAYNPLWIVRNKELIEIKGDKHPVGAFAGEELKQFTHKEFVYEEGDMLYIFTDGYADQFGGVKGKKFKYKQLQEVLISNSSKSTAEQKIILEKTIEAWQGNLEQIDDILIIGIRM